MFEIIEALNAWIATNPDSDLMEYARTGMSALVIFYLRRMTKQMKSIVSSNKSMNTRMNTQEQRVTKLETVNA